MASVNRCRRPAAVPRAFTLSQLSRAPLLVRALRALSRPCRGLAGQRLLGRRTRAPERQIPSSAGCMLLDVVAVPA